MLNSFETEVNLSKNTNSDLDIPNSDNVEDVKKDTKEFDIDSVLCSCIV